MSKFLVVARREVAERSFVFLGALLFALAPLLGLLGRGPMNQKLELVSLFSMIASASFVFGLAGGLGNSLVGREVREKRLSFYLARPLSASQIWFGKLCGAVALLIGSTAILWAPALLYPQSWRSGWNIESGEWIGVSLAAAFVVMMLVHAVSTMLRSRSPWLVLDGIMAIVLLAGAAAAILPLVFHGAFLLFPWVITALIAIVLVAMIAAGRSQLARGGIDIQAQHRAFSRTLWSIIGAGVMASLALTGWVQNVGVHDLEQPTVDGSASLLTVRGKAVHRGGYRAFFVVDPETGKSQEIRNFGFIGANTASVATAMVWRDARLPDLFRMMVGIRPGGIPDVSVVRKNGRALERIDTSIAAPPLASLAVSADGRRVAVATGSLAVFDVDDGHLVAAARLPARDRVFAHFLPTGVVRIEQSRRANLGGTAWCGVSDFDPRTRILREVFSRSVQGTSIFASSSPDGSKLFVTWRNRTGGPLTRTMVDVASGREVTPDAPQGMVIGRGMVLAGGDLIFLGTTARTDHRSDVSLLVESPDGKLLRTIPVGEAAWPRLGGEIAPGIVVVSLTNTGLGGSTVAVNVVTGQIVRRIDGILLPGEYWGSTHFTRGEAVIQTPDAVVAWNPVSGVSRKLL